MSTPLQQHDTKNLNLKETELRLGLPGSHDSPPPSLMKINNNNNTNNNVSGAKRGFTESNDNWVLTMNGKSEVDEFKGENDNKTTKEASFVVVVPHLTTKPLDDMKKNEVPAAKTQVVGWPPIRSYRKNTMASNLAKSNDEDDEKSGVPGCLYVKVSLDGAPYLRKVDLKTYNNYREFSSALEKMFRCFTNGKCDSHGLPGQNGPSDSGLMDLVHGSEYVLTYEDKDGDWMLVGDVPWGMFTSTCRRLRIMKGTEAIGLSKIRN
ncbi:hypothetical protein ACFE04_003765 [Oxalis oulophora]